MKKFSAGFLEQVKRITGKDKHCFILVPPGSDKHYDNILAFAPNASFVKYQQGNNQRTCLTYSFASALHHAGAKQVASMVYNMASKIMEKHNTLILLLSC